MTQEDKELLFKDLCARYPYGVICDMWDELESESKITEKLKMGGLSAFYEHHGFGVRPYLRSMSSMTEEEKKDLKKEHLKDEKLYAECLTNAANGDSSMRGKVIPHFAADWCNKNHFDYRGLIPMGLALEAPEGMYETE